MKKITLLFLCFFAFAANAKEVVVSAFGEGDDYDWAVLNAVENAVRQTSDISIEGNGLKKIDRGVTAQQESSFTESAALKEDLNLKANSDSFSGSYQGKADYSALAKNKASASYHDNSKAIDAKYKGIVSSYEVVEHTQKKGKHQVRINAVIIKDDVYDSHDYKSKDLIKKASYSLAVLPFKANKKFKCLGKDISMDEMNSLIVDSFIENLTPTRKFNLVDRTNIDSYQKELSLITDDMTLPENRTKLKNIVSADYILVGKIENFSATSSKEYVEFTGETSYESHSKLKLSYRILETATMEIISVGSVEEKFSKEAAFSSCYNVEELLVNKAVEKATNKLLKDLFPDYNAQK